MSRRPPFVLALLLALGAWCAACGSSDAAPTRRPAHVLPLTFTRSGGFAGVQDTLRVARDGRARAGRRFGHTRRFRLRGRALTELRGAIRAARLPRRAVYDNPPGTADAFAYRIAVPGHVVTAGEAGSAPPRVRRLIARLSRLVA